MKILTSLLLIVFLINTPAAFAFAKKPVSAVQPAVKKKVYMCPMQCVLSEKPGKCPKCGMDMWEATPV